MTILIMILKIVGIVLLVFLGLVVLLILAVMFVPVRYKGSAVFQKDKTPFFRVSVNYMLHLIAATFLYRDGKAEGKVRILFWKKNLLKEEEVRNEESKQAKRSKEGKDISHQNRKNKNFSGFIMALPAMIEELQKEENKQAFALCIQQVKNLCRQFGPRKLTGNITFSLGDPAYTGLAVGCISLFPLIYKNEFQVRPDFESDKIYAEGRIDFSGRMHILHAVVCFIKLFQNKTIRRLLIKGGSSNVRK